MDRNYADMMALTAETVALRKESVDRNAIAGLLALVGAGRSPQGERG